MLYVLSLSVFFPSRIFAKKIPIAFSENKRRRTKRKKTATFIIVPRSTGKKAGVVMMSVLQSVDHNRTEATRSGCKDGMLDLS